MKKHHVHSIYTLILAVTLLFYAGCTSGSLSGGSTGGSGPDNFRYGSDALRIDFHPGNAYRFYEGDDVTLLLELQNKGTADIEGGELFLAGYDKSFLNFQLDPGVFFSIDGKDRFDPNGDFFETYTLTARNVRLPRERDELRQSIMVTACYDYKTTMSAEVCVDPDPYNRRLKDKACELSVRGVSAQGHPVTISSVTPTVNSKDIRFAIKFGNSGSGTVYDRRVSYEKCNIGLDYDELDMVYVDRVLLGTNTLKCEPDNPVRMNNGGSIICTCENCIDQTLQPYWTFMEIDLSYGYKNTIQRDVVIFGD